VKRRRGVGGTCIGSRGRRARVTRKGSVCGCKQQHKLSGKGSRLHPRLIVHICFQHKTRVSQLAYHSRTAMIHPDYIGIIVRELSFLSHLQSTHTQRVLSVWGREEQVVGVQMSNRSELTDRRRYSHEVDGHPVDGTCWVWPHLRRNYF
jgi:hypothetical protein